MECCVKNCSNDTKTLQEDHGITFHMFPRDRCLRNTWTEILGMVDKPKVNSTVCSDHFKSQDIYVTPRGQPRIRNGALPVVVQVCRACLATDVKMYSMRHRELQQIYTDICGINMEEDKLRDKLPEKLCWECSARLLASARFRSRAITSHQLLTRLLRRTRNITLSDINSINRSENELESNLSLHYNEPNDYDIFITEDILIKTDNDNMEIEKESSEEDDFEEEYLEEETREVEETNESNNDLHYDNENVETSDVADDSGDEPEDNEDFLKIALDENNTENTIDDDVQIDSNNSKEKLKKNVKVGSTKEEGAKNKRIEKKTGLDESNFLDETMFTITPLSIEEQLEEARQRRDVALRKNAKYRCPQCGLGFRRSGRFSAHVARHSELAGAFECRICGRRQKSALALDRHLVGFHSRRYSCNQCSFRTQNRTTARDHQARHKGVTYYCPHCPCEFDTRSTYMGHLRGKHRAESICELCGYTFLSQRGVVMHKNTIHRFADKNMPLEGPYCDTCDVTFVSEEAYDRHLKFASQHSDENDTNQIHNAVYLLDRDKTSHKVVGRTPEMKSSDLFNKDSTSKTVEAVSCEYCDSKFPDFRLYAQHIRVTHPVKIRTQFSGKSEVIICDQCGRIFQSINVLREHMTTHNSLKLFRCGHCYRRFDQETDFIRHIKRTNHSGKSAPVAKSDKPKQRKKYTCSICDKEFSNSGNRIKHMWIHTARKPFKCTACDRTFAYQSILNIHFNNNHLKPPSGKRKTRSKAPVED